MARTAFNRNLQKFAQTNAGLSNLDAEAITKIKQFDAEAVTKIKQLDAETLNKIKTVDLSTLASLATIKPEVLATFKDFDDPANLKLFFQVLKGFDSTQINNLKVNLTALGVRQINFPSDIELKDAAGNPTSE